MQIHPNTVRAWVEKHKGFILKLADLEDSGADVVSLFHSIMDELSYLKAVKKIMDPEFALFVNHYLEQDNLELLIRTAIDLRSGMRAVSVR